jgi:hypothetical protein
MPTNRFLTIALDDQGSISVTPENLELNEGDPVEITITRPNTALIYCTLLFDKSSNDQDPFNSTTGGLTSFSLASGVTSTTYTVANDASIQNDGYSIILSASVIYVKDPSIIVKS